MYTLRNAYTGIGLQFRNRNNGSKNIFVQVADVFYSDRGVEVQSLEITRFAPQLQSPKPDELLQHENYFFSSHMHSFLSFARVLARVGLLSFKQVA